ncbi:MAG: hypothetical protein IJ462_01525 [Clostridia bacterium]|nr:hypothetical protein [Clostridia bacterium]
MGKASTTASKNAQTLTPPIPDKPKRKRRWGDRYDGYRVRELDGLFYLIPSIMRERHDSQVLFEEDIPIENLEKYVHRKRKEGCNIRTLHVFLAAMVRVMAMYPRINRFVSGKKIYAHKDIRISMAIKRNMSIDGEETNIMPVFPAGCTLDNVSDIFETELFNSRGHGNEEDTNATDGVVKVLKVLPTWFISFFVWLMKKLDNHGKMPKVINKASPFHSGAFVTDLGSIGIDSIFHHLYDFGTCSIFLAIGKKQTKLALDKNGEPYTQKFISCKFVLDERICDGYYYANVIKVFRRFIKHPELLELPLTDIPEEI